MSAAIQTDGLTKDDAATHALDGVTLDQTRAVQRNHGLSRGGTRKGLSGGRHGRSCIVRVVVLITATSSLCITLQPVPSDGGGSLSSRPAGQRLWRPMALDRAGLAQRDADATEVGLHVL